MQSYRDFAAKRGVELRDRGDCELCGATAERAAHECVEILEVGYGRLDLSEAGDHGYRFFLVDAHALQHPELHGRWSNHFHLARLCLVFDDGVQWRYADSPRLSAALNRFKTHTPHAALSAPPRGKRGAMTAADLRAAVDAPARAKRVIADWARSVHHAWAHEHAAIAAIREGFLSGRR